MISMSAFRLCGVHWAVTGAGRTALLYRLDKINMNSLRTDDILGAKPRVRHMPRNLIRERQVPTSFLLNL